MIQLKRPNLQWDKRGKKKRIMYTQDSTYSQKPLQTSTQLIPLSHCPPGLIWDGDWVNGARLSSIHLFCRPRLSSSLLALFWFDCLWFYGASPYGLGCGDGGFVGIWAVASCLVVWGWSVEWGLSSLIEPRHFADLRGLELLLIWEKLMSGLEHLSSLLCLEGETPKPANYLKIIIRLNI